MSRRILMVLGIASLVVVALVAGFTWLLHDPVNPWNSSRIRVGMTKQEVERILGQPAFLEMLPLRGGPHFSSPEPVVTWERYWLGSEWVIQVDFDTNEKVLAVDYDVALINGSPPNAVRRRVWGLLGW
jgi:hypothetical protein